jgi:hypothetical protein
MLNTVLRMNEWAYVEKLALLIFPLKLACEGFFPEFPSYGGFAYRGLVVGTKAKAQLDELEAGDMFYFPAFTSCSKNANIAAFFTSCNARSRVLFPTLSGDDFLVVLEIQVHREHSCAIDLKGIAQNEFEDEVLLNSYTRFRFLDLKRNVRGGNGTIDYYLMLETVEPAYETVKEWETERNLREQIAGDALGGDFDSVLSLTLNRRDLLNSFRPSSSSLWTPLHQAAYYRHKAERDLRVAGAKDLFNAVGEKPADLKKYI